MGHRGPVPRNLKRNSGGTLKDFPWERSVTKLKQRKEIVGGEKKLREPPSMYEVFLGTTPKKQKKKIENSKLGIPLLQGAGDWAA